MSEVVVGHGHYEKIGNLKQYSFVNNIYVIANPYPRYKGPDARFVEENIELITRTKELLVDEKSKRALECYVRVNETEDINELLNKDICMPGMFGLEIV